MDVQQKIVTIALLVVGVMVAHMETAAAAVLTKSEPVYETYTVYEDRTTCTKGDDKTTEGAIIGGTIGAGSSDDKAEGFIIGAIIGGIIGDAVGEEKCTTEKVAVGQGQTYVGENVTLIGENGKTYVVFLPAE